VIAVSNVVDHAHGHGVRTGRQEALPRRDPSRSSRRSGRARRPAIRHRGPRARRLASPCRAGGRRTGTRSEANAPSRRRCR
jgi:hypothetical protein